MRSVIMYWCSTETSGTLTPAMRPTSRAHWPAQLTTVSQRTVPSVVSTATTRAPSMRNPVTSTSSIIFAPCMRAPLASEAVMSEGLACPSVGRKAAPTTSETSISGQRSCASFGESRCISSPKDRAVVACRLTSVQRSLLQARRRPPFIFQPVARPVSCSSVR